MFFPSGPQYMPLSSENVAVLLVPYDDEHYTRAWFMLEVWTFDPSITAWKKDYARNSPIVHFEYGPNMRILDAYAVTMIGALTRDEVTRKTKERVVHDILWMGLQTSEGFCRWVATQFPKYWGAIKDSPLLAWKE